ncbi:hypothetical protein SAMN03159463_01103 [Mesorhizobium sp. NFR06]|uniref:hypothetical protein n=1 Tax=Mesorhizobium sp. NFR06 TaxID=1566290 RepID=UPI0008EF37ED|nr:hypothetical protein [Mesorhizobium sp. NFR06]SFO09741.1 hypothetical protein SAMN03159463_01103 [Mesorhizobium sp. NFR06]
MLPKFLTRQSTPQGIKPVMVADCDEQVVTSSAFLRLAHPGNNQTGYSVLPAKLATQGPANRCGNDQPDAFKVGKADVLDHYPRDPAP